MKIIHTLQSRRAWRTAATSLVLLVSACTHAPKNVAERASVDPAKGTVYVYRTSSEVGRIQPFYMTLDGKPVSPLANASYVALSLEPGTHKLSVSPGPLGYNRGVDVKVEAGATAFYQFETEPSEDRQYFGKTVLRSHDEATARSAMAGLTRSVALFNDRRLTSPRTRFAAVGDVLAVPAVDERGREAYRTWLKQRMPRAFVVGSNGSFFSAWGMAVTDIPGLSDPATRAMQRCATRRGVVCQLYAINNSVVWKPLPLQVVQRERERMAASRAAAVQGEDEAAVQAPSSSPAPQ